MKIIKSQEYLDSLKNILSYIAEDKKSAAISFNTELTKSIKTLKDFPYKYQQSKYFDQENIRDLQYKGYSIPYLIAENSIIIIGITKYRKSFKHLSNEEFSDKYGKEVW